MPTPDPSVLIVLVIEDNLDNRLVVREFLKHRCGVRHCLEASAGRHIFEHLRMQSALHPVDLILLDINLPDIDGRTLVLQLKKQLGGPAAPPIVALTARTGENEVYLAQKFGCTAFVSKPFQPEDLLSLIRELVPAFAEG